MIGYENGKTLIYAGNVISNEKVDILDKQLNFEYVLNYHNYLSQSFHKYSFYHKKHKIL